jgi:hypothetical protein
LFKAFLLRFVMLEKDERWKNPGVLMWFEWVRHLLYMFVWKRGRGFWIYITAAMRSGRNPDIFLLL